MGQTVTPKKDISAFTIVSPEYHLEATTKLTPKEEFEQDLNLPVVKQGEIMTIERLVKEFGPYIGWSQKVTEQGKVKKDSPTKRKETTIDEKTKATTTIEHHYKVVDNGKPQTVALNVLGSKLNYPKTILLTEDHFTYLANSFGCEAAAIKALMKQETVGKGHWEAEHGFDKNGLPRILYERHKFYLYTMSEVAARRRRLILLSKKWRGTTGRHEFPCASRHVLTRRADYVLAGPQSHDGKWKTRCPRRSCPGRSPPPAMVRTSTPSAGCDSGGFFGCGSITMERGI
ncbi:N-acetylmuramidase domain-containing protein [Paraburkholderia sp. LEh10]|uniref:N-acetylmuramidase domain-containing protein n=1 Tax=Paraburkholderia sp. LEh10 TaxID=2821353 RepID=UPI0028AEDE64|nr:N-acetylmuramidase domain-containing protein [Paraburkholderia sp. LEh10]